MRVSPDRTPRGARLVLLAFLPLLLAAGPDPAGKCEQGTATYEAGDYEEALRIYTDALVDAPDLPELRFNIGAAKYKLDRYDEAMEDFRSVLTSGNTALIAQARYNIGNSLYRKGEQAKVQGNVQEVLKNYEAAVESYIEALKLDPDDVEAKRNIEIIRRRIKEMLERQQQEQQQQDQQREESDQPQPNQAGNSEKTTPTPQTPREPEPEPPPEPEGTPRYLTPEEAEQLLDSLDREQREELWESRQRRPPQVEADW